MLEAANRRDLDAVVALSDPEFVGEVPADMSVEPDVYVGHEGIRRYFESFWEIVDGLTMECDAFVQVGSWTIASAARPEFRAWQRPPGRRLDRAQRPIARRQAHSHLLPSRRGCGPRMGQCRVLKIATAFLLRLKRYCPHVERERGTRAHRL